MDTTSFRYLYAVCSYNSGHSNAMSANVANLDIGEVITNNPPTVSNPSPADGATGVSINPTLSVDVSDADGDAINVSFYRELPSFTFENATHSFSVFVNQWVQGVATDGTYVYVSGTEGSYPGKVKKYTKEGSLVKEVDASTYGAYHISDIYYDACTGYLYLVDFKNWTSGQTYENAEGWVIVLDTDLNKIETHDLSHSPWAESITRFRNGWLVACHPDHELAYYDDDFNFLKYYNITGHNGTDGYAGATESDCYGGWQGITTFRYDNVTYIMLTVHQNAPSEAYPHTLWIYEYNNNTDNFTLVKGAIDVLDMGIAEQGLQTDPTSSNIVWFASRETDKVHEINVTVDFVKGQNSLLLGYDNINANSTASINLNNLNYGQKYSWYVIADDGTDTTTSSLWSFTTETPNNPSTVSNPYPVNGSINIQLQPTCHIDISDADGDTMTIYWYENSTGSWVLRQTNSSVCNGTYYWTFTQANQQGTT